jgi:hypothetical protein
MGVHGHHRAVAAKHQDTGSSLETDAWERRQCCNGFFDISLREVSQRIWRFGRQPRRAAIELSENAPKDLRFVVRQPPGPDRLFELFTRCFENLTPRGETLLESSVRSV